MQFVTLGSLSDLTRRLFQGIHRKNKFAANFCIVVTSRVSLNEIVLHFTMESSSKALYVCYIEMVIMSNFYHLQPNLSYFSYLHLMFLEAIWAPLCFAGFYVSSCLSLF